MGWVRPLLALWLLFASNSLADFTGKVVGVSDGDTITVLNERTPVKIRLFGIDCPETGQDFGSRAKLFTSEMVFGKVVKVVPHDTDRYGRTVADVVLPDGRVLNHELLKAGLAWWYRQYARNSYALATRSGGERSEAGPVSQPNPMPPWEWRGQKRALPAELTGKFIANSRSHVYHKPGCRNAGTIRPQIGSCLTRPKPQSERERTATRDKAFPVNYRQIANRPLIKVVLLVFNRANWQKRRVAGNRRFLQAAGEVEEIVAHRASNDVLAQLTCRDFGEVIEETRFHAALGSSRLVLKMYTKSHSWPEIGQSRS